MDSQNMLGKILYAPLALVWIISSRVRAHKHRRMMLMNTQIGMATTRVYILYIILLYIYIYASLTPSMCHTARGHFMLNASFAPKNITHKLARGASHMLQPTNKKKKKHLILRLRRTQTRTKTIHITTRSNKNARAFSIEKCARFKYIDKSKVQHTKCTLWISTICGGAYGACVLRTLRKRVVFKDYITTCASSYNARLASSIAFTSRTAY